MEATGPLGFQCQVSPSSMQESEQNEHHLIKLLPFLSLSGSSTCIQQSVSDGFFHNEDCFQFSNFVCELNSNAVFSEPPEGKVWFVLWTTPSLLILFLEKIFVSPDYPNNYPHNSYKVMAIWSCCLTWEWINCCRLGSCSQPMEKQSPSPSTVWILILVLVLAPTGWRSMMGPPPSATAAQLGIIIISMVMVTISAPQSPAPSPAPAPSGSRSARIPFTQKVGS